MLGEQDTKILLLERTSWSPRGSCVGFATFQSWPKSSLKTWTCLQGHWRRGKSWL